MLKACRSPIGGRMVSSMWRSCRAAVLKKIHPSCMCLHCHEEKGLYFMLTRIVALFCLLLPVHARAQAIESQRSGDKPVRVLIITGGHPFQEGPFLEIFSSIHSITFEHAKYGAGAEAKFKPEAATNYDVFVFYD